MILIGGGIALFIAAIFINSDSDDVYGFAVDKFLMEFGAFALILLGLIHVWVSLRRSRGAASDSSSNAKGPADTSTRALKIWLFTGMFALTVILFSVGINSLILQSEVSSIPNPGLNIMPADAPIAVLRTLTIFMGLWWPVSSMIMFFSYLTAKQGDEWLATIVWLLGGFPVAVILAALISYA